MNIVHETTTGRNYTIDIIKLIAAFFVVCIHTKTTSAVDGFEQGSFSFVIDNIARFAVPFFFMASGFLIDFSNRKKLLTRIGKVVVIYATWSLLFIYIRQHNGLDYPVFQFTGNTVLNDKLNVWYKIFFYGYERHLWFFIAYIIAALIVVFLRRKQWLLLTVALIFYALGLTGQQFRFIYPEQLSFLPMPTSEWLRETYFTRSGLFFAFPCMALGHIIRKQEYRIKEISTIPLSVLIAALFILQYYECIWMVDRYDSTTADYYISTLLLSSSILVLAIRYPGQSSVLSITGKLSGGVYLIHPLFMYFFLINYKELFGLEWWAYAFTPILIMLSLLSAFIISKIPFVRKLIMM